MTLWSRHRSTHSYLPCSQLHVPDRRGGSAEPLATAASFLTVKGTPSASFIHFPLAISSFLCSLACDNCWRMSGNPFACESSTGLSGPAAITARAAAESELRRNQAESLKQTPSKG
eukprot:gene8742-biopygen4546